MKIIHTVFAFRIRGVTHVQAYYSPCQVRRAEFTVAITMIGSPGVPLGSCDATGFAILLIYLFVCLFNCGAGVQTQDLTHLFAFFFFFFFLEMS
jgi:hypothetical protein